MQTATRRREQEVWQACDDLWAMHGNTKMLTGEAIKEHLLQLGKSKGSPNEIYKYRKTWEESRGVGISLEHSLNQEAFSDPISRAVKMVHEKLQSETSEIVDKIKEDFIVQLKAKDEEFEKAKHNLDNLVNQYCLLEEQCSAQDEKLKELLAKIAREQEENTCLRTTLNEEKNNFEQKLQSLNTAIESCKMVHADELVRLKKIYEEQISFLQAQYSSSQDKMLLLGKDFSEQLMEIKTKNYNLNIKLDEAVKKSISLEINVESLTQKCIEQKAQVLKKENENLELKTMLNSKKVDLYRADKELKFALTTIARLRALNK